MDIQRSTFYRAQHVTGPACVLVSIKFGKTPEGGPTVIRLLGATHSDPTPKFDITNHVQEITAGVEAANAEHAGRLQVEAIEVVPDDFPSRKQAEFVAYKIATAVLRGEI